MKNELKKYIKENLKRSKNSHSFFKFKLKAMFVSDEDIVDTEVDNEFVNTKNTLDIEKDVIPFLEKNGIKLNEDEYNLKEYIKDNNKYSDFQTTLFKMIDQRHLIDADVYNKVHIDRRLFSKIRNDKNYHPSKETIILLGLSLELSEEEIELLLDSASYSLPRNNHYDLVIRFCFKKGIYQIGKVNELLEEYNCKLFNY